MRKWSARHCWEHEGPALKCLLRCSCAAARHGKSGRAAQRAKNPKEGAFGTAACGAETILAPSSSSHETGQSQGGRRRQRAAAGGSAGSFTCVSVQLVNRNQ
jgi:hypothetical protein